MRETVLCGSIRLLRGFFQAVYEVLKLFPTRDRVCFFSRQSDTATIDFILLQEELRKSSPQTEQIMICHRFRDHRDRAFLFAVQQVRSMYLLATSRACVLDAYWPAVCLLRHSRKLRVIQIWHSVGKIKKSGYQTLGMSSGRNRRLAAALCMHRNYSYIISGGRAWESFYCEAFDTTPDRLRSYGLPRLDWLIHQPGTRERLEKDYPELQGKSIVLYAPTYRRYPISSYRELSSLFQGTEFALICRFHPNQVFEETLPEDVLRYDREETFILLKACDWLITDYSSLALEGAALGKKTMYYLFDHDRYMKENGLNIDPAEEMPGCSFADAEEMISAMKHDAYPFQQLRRYKERYLPEDLGRSAERIVALLNGAEGSGTGEKR